MVRAYDDWGNVVDLVQHENEIYNQALDDFNNLIKDYVLNNGTIPNHFNSDLIAEQLKKGYNNETN